MKFIVRDPNGDVVFTVGQRLGKVLKVMQLNSTTGTATVNGLEEGTPFHVISANYSNPAVLPYVNVTITGNTIRWTTNSVGSSLILGVY